ncbi:Fe2+-dependent dioxygenase [Ectopseudomonas mendocina]|jgi:PKHD-type hydroxylase|uniref:Fe2+-dependent dioxygenase n=1 Tax=Ectopseudomonas mendocina TaxID=300 RepID=A0ABD7S0E4_ECTME|nr:Fe2+-dependent dioxygenase [Pseudomonas mendocina]TRO14278.1 Fe2+-dependent dioxygenase [Pseudomonas mendocina]TRO19329.1 Fe2+-dependent dioxygenase [Pseudomonas mendocina]
MLIEIEGLLSAEEVDEVRRQLLAQPWVDGKVTAGVQSAQVKANRQLDEDNPLARQLGELILRRLSDNALFMSAALPKRIYPPLFNRYGDGEAFGFHVDNAVRGIKGVRERVRTDLSATLFLADPASYDGGELVIRDTFGEQRVKLAAGNLVLYPGSSLHRVEPVTRGERLASFFWIESLVREDSQRQMLLDMDVAIQRLTAQGADDQSLLELTGVYHNLLRRWSDT